MLSLALLFFTAGCSSFHRDWKQRAAPAPAPDALEGRWEGTWLSGANGHTGKLRCIVTRIEGDKYQFQYWATFWKIFRASYTVYFDAKKSGVTYQLTGTSDLGWLGGGVYEYQGAVNGTNFSATYKSKADHGTFKMSRP
ncbi:MAG: hypothetical protein HZA89_03040 [Verrucomicrobia bacterium]|nr:hypothetical protein [Verrucomicrobiota bacterium]